MHNFYRTMPIGSTRVYAKTDGAMNLQSYLAAVKAGKSFVTTGPLLKFTANGKEAGDVIAAGEKQIEWKIEAFSTSRGRKSRNHRQRQSRLDGQRL